MSRAATTGPAAVMAAALAAIAALSLSSRGQSGTASGGGAPPTPTPQVIPVASRVPAPAFTGPSLDGGGSSGPARFAGEVVVVAFWSSWCTPCRAELHQLQAAWKARVSSGRHTTPVQFLGVDVDDGPVEARSALRAAKVTFPNVADADSSIAAEYGIAGTPTLVFIDQRGREAARALGPTDTATLLLLVHRIEISGRAWQSPPNLFR